MEIEKNKNDVVRQVDNSVHVELVHVSEFGGGVVHHTNFYIEVEKDEHFELDQ